MTISIEIDKYKAVKVDVHGYCTGCVALQDSGLCGLIRNTLANETYYLNENNICDIFGVIFKEMGEIRINGIEIPEPLRIMPNHGDIFWVVSSAGVFQVRNTFDHYGDAFKNGALHLKKEDAQIHYDAIWSPTRIKE